MKLKPKLRTGIFVNVFKQTIEEVEIDVSTLQPLYKLLSVDAVSAVHLVERVQSYKHRIEIWCDEEGWLHGNNKNAAQYKVDNYGQEPVMIAGNTFIIGTDFRKLPVGFDLAKAKESIRFIRRT